MLTIWREHVRKCEHRCEGRAYRRCKCPIWVEGSIEGKIIRRRTLDTRNWERAQDIVRQSEAAGYFTKAEPISLAGAQAKFTTDAKARSLRPGTLKKYRVLFDQMNKFAKLKGLLYVSQFDLGTSREFRESWADAALAATKKLERFRSFLRFCKEGGWITENAAKLIRAPKVTQSPTLPLEKEEVGKILKACRTNKERAMVLLLRFSGLAIEDASTLACDRLRDGRVFLYRHKTGVVVWVPIPPAVVLALETLEHKSVAYFFWTGEGKPETQAGNVRRTLRKLFRRAGVPDAHPHRFRDTFAVELLLAGVPIERVSILLGHSSIKITEKHYAPWVRSRQEQLEADVARTWEPPANPGKERRPS